MATVIRTIKNLLAVPITITTQKIVLQPDQTTDLYTVLTDDQLKVAQPEIQGLIDRGTLSLIATDNLDEFVAQTYDGPVRYTKDGSVIFYEKRAEVIEECSCIKYQCGDS